MELERWLRSLGLPQLLTHSGNRTIDWIALCCPVLHSQLLPLCEFPMISRGRSRCVTPQRLMVRAR